MKNGRPNHVLGLGLIAAALTFGACAGAEPTETVPREATVLPDAAAAALYVSPSGDDAAAGTIDAPMKTINAALAKVPDGGSVIVRPGVYTGRIRPRRKFTQMVTLRSEVPYRAQLRNDTAQVIYVGGASNVTIEGFDIAHTGRGAAAVVVQIDGQGIGTSHHIALRNNILHDSYNNDIIKINNGAHDITVAGNLLYNQANSDEHMDINSVDNVVVEDNVMFNDLAGAGRTDATQTSSFIVVKDSNDDDDQFMGARNVIVRRNVMLGWQGSVGHGFLLCGEDGRDYYEAYDMVVENNLMLGDSAAVMRAPFSVKGCRDVTFRNNTISGDLPGSAYALRIIREWQNQPAKNIRMFNNVWADQSGTMTDFSDAPPSEVASFMLSRNLFWNAGQPVPEDAADAVNPSADATRVVADPGLKAPTGVALPRWSAGDGRFLDGSETIAQIHAQLVDAYAVPGAAVVDQADPANAAQDDIRGNARGPAPDLGALEVNATAAAPGAGPAPANGCAAVDRASALPTRNTPVPAKSGVFQVLATLVPGAQGMDGGFGLSSGAISYWANAAAIVLFEATGLIKARNGAVYDAARAIVYQPGAPYRVRMDVNVPAHSYSAYVTGPDGVEQPLAENFAFRSEFATVASLDNWAARVETGSLQACDVAVQ